MDARDTRVGELPVAVELPARLDAEVTGYVEREVGWRRVPLEGPPPPALLLTQRPRPMSDGWPPSVVILEEPADAEAVRRALLDGAVDVLAWPGERTRLSLCADRVPARRALPPAPMTVRVGGLGGGAGTSTVALALAGLAAWAGRRTVFAGSARALRLAGAARWRGPGADDLERLAPDDAAREFAQVSRPVPGVPGLRILPASAVPAALGWPVDVLISDVGAPLDPQVVDVLVARPDASLEQASGSATPLVVVGEGPWSAAQVRRLLGREPVAWLPQSARVARAACAGRVPAALPGSYLAALRRGLGWPQ